MKSLDLSQFAPVELPRFLRVRQHFEKDHIRDVAKEVKARLAPHLAHVRGKRIAVGIGSRGIANLYQIARSLVDELVAAGADPFVVPSMGSHGGATAAA